MGGSPLRFWHPLVSVQVSSSFSTGTLPFQYRYPPVSVLLPIILHFTFYTLHFPSGSLRESPRPTRLTCPTCLTPAARKGSQPTPQGHRRHASRATQKSVQGRCLTPAGEIANPSREEHPSQQGRLLHESPAHLPQAKGAHLMSSGGRNRWARRLRRLGGLGDLDLHAQGCWRQAKSEKSRAKSM